MEVFTLMWDVWKDFEAFHRSESFCLEKRGLCNDYESFKRHCQRSGGFYKHNEDY
jgi:hypothetical protein